MTDTSPRTRSVMVRVVGSVVAIPLALFSFGVLTQALRMRLRPGGLEEGLLPVLRYGLFLFLVVLWAAALILTASWGLRGWVSRIALGLAAVLSAVAIAATVSA